MRTVCCACEKGVHLTCTRTNALPVGTLSKTLEQSNESGACLQAEKIRRLRPESQSKTGLPPK